MTRRTTTRRLTRTSSARTGRAFVSGQMKKDVARGLLPVTMEGLEPSLRGMVEKMQVNDRRARPALLFSRAESRLAQRPGPADGSGRTTC